ncbi:MAG: hypothetical protein CL608_05165 [Anaerolineaceae bacterium]|nr:hypothetical protein [Anaerolineaceae bacterium]
MLVFWQLLTDRQRISANLYQIGDIVVTKKQIAILSNNEHSPWLRHLTEVLGSLGQLIVYGEDMFEEDSGESLDIDMLLVDASGLKMELAERVAWLHGRFPQVPIVVLTSSPTWRRARAVLQAGAADYMRRSLEDERLLARCRSLLHCPP